MSGPGIFIVLDGLDGCGKSTQALRLCDRLRTLGHDVLHTREPGGTPLGERVRSILLDPEVGDIAPLSEMFLYQASRAQLVDALIRPALEGGRVVVCERWHYATRAYQGAYRGVGRRAGEEALEASSNLAVGETEPHRAVLLDMPAGQADARLGRLLDRVEARGDDYREAVAARFRAIFAREPERLRVVSAVGSMDAVATRVWEAVRDISPEHPLLALGDIGARLQRTLEGGRLSPSYLFEGADPDLLEEAALAFAAAILTQAPPGTPEAGELERVRAGHHPGLQRLGRDKATVISVAALTPMLARAFLTPLEGARQVFVIEPADAMEPEGIARYLKVLEEPPAGTVFLLLTCNAERLPDTVLSRCRRVRFPPTPPGVVRAQLCNDDVPADTAAWAARCSGGSLARARRLADGALHGVATGLCSAGLAQAAGASAAAEDALRRLEHGAAERAAADTREVDTKRQHVRELLGDLLHALCIEARERAADRTSALLPDVSADEALALLEGWGRLAAVVPANVTPAAILLEIVAILRRATGVLPSTA